MDMVGPDKRLHYYRMTPDDVMIELRGHKMGLTNVEAARRLKTHGHNTLHHARRETIIVTFLRQFKSLFVAILLLSAALSFYLRDGKTAVILILIALTNATVGFFQEHKAETLMADLEHLLVPRAKVLRNGTLKEIDSTELVPGDIVQIQEGDSVPADLRILEEDELSTNDFALTGESNPSRKFVHPIASPVPLASRNNLAFMGTTVATGTARGIVIGTGMDTELGRIASLAQVTQADTSPLQQEMNNLAKRLMQGALILAVILAVVAIKADTDLKSALLFAIGISAAMIPNGLAAEVNIALAQTANRMTKARALVKRLSAVETLGATNIILTDKTGTLTKNEMTVTELLIGRSLYTVTGTGYQPAGKISNAKGATLGKESTNKLSLFFMTGALASNAKVNQPDAGHPLWHVIGDPTEGAIVTLARKAGLNTEKLDSRYPEVREFQFDSGRKLMSSVRCYDDGSLAVFVKGAPEAVLTRSTKLWDHNLTRRLAASDRAFFAAHNDASADRAMRNLAFGYRLLPKGTDPGKLDMQEVEQNLTFLGMVSMQDPLRDDVPVAMASAQAAHVRVSVITGDYPVTTKAIAAQAGLASPSQQAKIIMADELAGLPDKQILHLIETGGAVFSRVSPEDKLRIVDIAKSGGQVVAVTGDGINDAPALKRADIGVAMGKTGTDVAKDTADIVLLDDSFATLVGAIEQGRLTYHNIRKATRCALTDNAGELLIILIGLALGAVFHIPMPITALQILAVDIVAEIPPITALGWDTAGGHLMREHPRRLSDHIINRKAVIEFIAFGLLAAGLASLSFLFFFARRGLSPSFIDTTSQLYAAATTLTYLTLVLCQFTNILLVRADAHKRFFTSYLWSNKYLLAAFALSIVCLLNLIYNPWVQPYFRTSALSATDWLTALAACGIYFSLRLLWRHTRQHSRKAVLRLHQQAQSTR